MIEIEGKYTTAIVQGLEEEQLEDGAREQIQEMTNHEAFVNDIRVMPDVHVGKGSVIGFTMPVADKIIPNVIGVDIGCGMLAVRLSGVSDELRTDDGLDHEEIDQRVRGRVPMGWGQAGVKAPDREYHNVHEEMDYGELDSRLEQFVETVGLDYTEPMREFLDNGGYDLDFFKGLVENRAKQMSYHFDMNTAINQFGTLGSGNHFIELAKSEQTGDLWVVIHSGSRKLGSNTAEYWQQQAIDIEAIHSDWRAERVSEAREVLEEYPTEYVKFDVDAVTDKEMLNWLQGGMGEDFVNYDAIPPEEREDVRKELKRVVPEADDPPEVNVDESLDYLTGEEAGGYLLDMLFCQQYAVKNRLLMARGVADVLGASIEDEIHSIHNFIDFRDGIIRKGSTRAYDGELGVVPFNMQAGTLIVEGKGNKDWNWSVCHGAGRVMSRREAERTFTEDEIRAQMDDVDAYASELPLDEAPNAYKDVTFVENAITETADVVDRLNVVHNFKAGD